MQNAIPTSAAPGDRAAAVAQLAAAAAAAAAAATTTTTTTFTIAWSGARRTQICANATTIIAATAVGSGATCVRSSGICEQQRRR